jgi:hypothetical protein
VTDQLSDGFHAIQCRADSHGSNPHLNVFARETCEYLELGEQPKGFEKFKQIALGPSSDGGQQPGPGVATASLRTAEQSSQKLRGFGILRLADCGRAFPEEGSAVRTLVDPNRLRPEKVASASTAIDDRRERSLVVADDADHPAQSLVRRVAGVPVGPENLGANPAPGQIDISRTDDERPDSEPGVGFVDHGVDESRFINPKVEGDGVDYIVTMHCRCERLRVAEQALAGLG